MREAALPQTWAELLTELLRALLRHFLSGHAQPSARKTLLFNIVKHESRLVAPNAPHSKFEARYPWQTCASIVLQLGARTGPGHEGAAAPFRAPTFLVPGDARRFRSGDPELGARTHAQYSARETLWCLGGHAWPCADRATARFQDVGRKAALRCAAGPWAPSFGVLLATDSRALLQAAQTQFERLRAGPLPYTEPRGLFRDIARTLGASQKQLRFRVGPEVLFARATASESELTHTDALLGGILGPSNPDAPETTLESRRARLLVLEHEGALHAVFVDPAPLEEFVGDPVRAAPIAELYGGLLCLPCGPRGLSDWLPLSAIAAGEQPAVARAAREDPKVLLGPLGLRALETRFVWEPERQTHVALLWYAGCADPLLGTQVRRARVGGAWIWVRDEGR